MNRTQIEQEVKNLEAQLEEKRKQLEAMPKRWRLSEGSEYWYVNSRFEIGNYIESSRGVDIILFDNGNYFETPEEAEAMAEKTKLMFEMTARVKELNGDWVADWGNQNTKKWGIKNSEDGYKVDWCVYYNWNVFNLSVQSKEHAEILLNEFKERIERWY